MPQDVSDLSDLANHLMSRDTTMVTAAKGEAITLSDDSLKTVIHALKASQKQQAKRILLKRLKMVGTVFLIVLGVDFLFGRLFGLSSVLYQFEILLLWFLTMPLNLSIRLKVGKIEYVSDYALMNEQSETLRQLESELKERQLSRETEIIRALRYELDSLRVCYQPKGTAWRYVLSYSDEKLLPALRGADSEEVRTITEDKYEVLRWILEWPFDNLERTRLVLKLLAKDNSPQALRLAEKLSREPGTTPETVAVREMAAQCLAVMQERRERTKQSRTLLRGSEAPNTPQTLLRPVQTTPSETPSEQLLRPAHPDSNG